MSVTGPPLGWRAAAASTTPEIPYRFTPASFLTDSDRSLLLDRHGLRRPLRSDSRIDPEGRLHLRSPRGLGSQPWTIATSAYDDKIGVVSMSAVSFLVTLQPTRSLDAARLNVAVVCLGGVLNRGVLCDIRNSGTLGLGYE